MDWFSPFYLRGKRVQCKRGLLLMPGCAEAARPRGQRMLWVSSNHLDAVTHKVCDFRPLLSLFAHLKSENSQRVWGRILGRDAVKLLMWGLGWDVLDKTVAILMSPWNTETCGSCVVCPRPGAGLSTSGCWSLEGLGRSSPSLTFKCSLGGWHTTDNMFFSMCS